MTNSERSEQTRRALRAGLLFLVVGSAWIFFTDLAVSLLWTDAESIRLAQTIKGWLFVLGAAALLALVVYRERSWLERERSRYRRLFAASPLPMWVYDLETLRFLAVNEAAVTHYGYSEDEFLDMTIADIRPQEEVPRLHDDLARGSPAGIQTSGVWQHLRADGTTIDVEVTSHEIEFMDRRARLVLAHDVTARERAAAQLRLAQKMESLGRLAGGVAHDFNNLLTVINGLAEMGLSGLAPSDPLHADLEEILTAGRRAARLTRQLLTFGRRQSIDPELLRPAAVVAGMRRLLRSLLGENVELRLPEPPGPGLVRIDRGQLEQVIVNLAANARDAMPEGGVFEVAVERAEIGGREPAGPRHPDGAGPQPGEYVALTVRDDGHGMERAVRERAFEPFFTTKAEERGTGLGLSSVWGIVERAGGSISLETAPGEGTEVTILLPCRSAPEELADAGGSAPTPPPGSGSILVVEDDEAVRRVTVRTLASAGFEVFEAVGGAEALAFLEARLDVPDLVITDMVMPGMSGRELGRRLAERYPELAILYISGYSGDEAPELEGNGRRAHFLGKPFTAAQLLGEVRRMLADGSAA